MAQYMLRRKNSEEERNEHIASDDDYLQDMIERSSLQNSKHKDRRRTPCFLPCDGMTELELQAKNGPLEQWNLNEPMTPGKFRRMPEDLQDLYLKRLQERIFGKESVR